jgi:hypothetical protein
LEYLHIFKNATYNQWAIFYKLIFVSEDWPIDPSISFCSPSNLVQLIEIDLNFLEKSLKTYFEKNEVVEI